MKTLKQESMKKKQVKGKWYLVPGEYAVKSVDMLVDNALHIPARAFINTTTGEIRLFSENYVEKIGTDKVLKSLNSNIE